MPHLVILYTPQLDAETDMAALCRTLANTLMTIQDEAGQAVFPTGGTRVLAYAAAHHAVADGERDYAFAYLNLRMGRGRSETVKHHAGAALLAAANVHLAPVFQRRYLGVTLQIDEGAEVYDGKASNIHPLFSQP